MEKLVSLFVTGVALLALGLPAYAQSGVAEGVKPQANAKGNGGVRQLVVGSDVSIGETITTGGSGLVQLLFDDNTKLVIAANSSLVLEDYLIRANNSAGKFAINALSGSFRFITGNAPKNRYVIKTPTGTIGVRGTSFDFSLVGTTPKFVPTAPLTTALQLLDGGVRLCNLARRCVDVSDVCDFGAFNSAGAVNVENTREARTAWRKIFPFANNQRLLRRSYWVNGARECWSPAPNVPPPAASSGQLSDVPGGPAATTEEYTPPPQSPPPTPTPTPPPTYTIN